MQATSSISPRPNINHIKKNLQDLPKHKHQFVYLYEIRTEKGFEIQISIEARRRTCLSAFALQKIKIKKEEEARKKGNIGIFSNNIF